MADPAAATSIALRELRRIGGASTALTLLCSSGTPRSTRLAMAALLALTTARDAAAAKDVLLSPKFGTLTLLLLPPDVRSTGDLRDLVAQVVANASFAAVAGLGNLSSHAAKPTALGTILPHLRAVLSASSVPAAPGSPPAFSTSAGDARVVAMAAVAVCNLLRCTDCAPAARALSIQQIGVWALMGVIDNANAALAAFLTPGFATAEGGNGRSGGGTGEVQSALIATVAAGAHAAMALAICLGAAPTLISASTAGAACGCGGEASAASTAVDVDVAVAKAAAEAVRSLCTARHTETEGKAGADGHARDGCAVASLLRAVVSARGASALCTALSSLPAGSSRSGTPGALGALGSPLRGRLKASSVAHAKCSAAPVAQVAASPDMRESIERFADACMVALGKCCDVALAPARDHDRPEPEQHGCSPSSAAVIADAIEVAHAVVPQQLRAVLLGTRAGDAMHESDAAPAYARSRRSTSTRGRVSPVHLGDGVALGVVVSALSRGICSARKGSTGTDVGRTVDNVRVPCVLSFSSDDTQTAAARVIAAALITPRDAERSEVDALRLQLCPSVSADCQPPERAQPPLAAGAAGAETAAVGAPAALSLAWGLVHSSSSMRAAALLGLSQLIVPPSHSTDTTRMSITAATTQACASAVEHGVPVVLTYALVPGAASVSCDVAGREAATLLLQSLRRTLLSYTAPPKPTSGKRKSKARGAKVRTPEGGAAKPLTLLNALVAAASAPTSHPLRRAQCAASLCMLLLAPAVGQRRRASHALPLSLLPTSMSEADIDAAYLQALFVGGEAGDSQDDAYAGGLLRGVINMMLLPTTRGAALDFMQAIAPLLPLPPPLDAVSRQPLSPELRIRQRRSAAKPADRAFDFNDDANTNTDDDTEMGLELERDLLDLANDPLAKHRAAASPPCAGDTLPRLDGAAYRRLLAPDELVSAVTSGGGALGGAEALANDVFDFIAHALVEQQQQRRRA